LRSGEETASLILEDDGPGFDPDVLHTCSSAA